MGQAASAGREVFVAPPGRQGMGRTIVTVAVVSVVVLVGFYEIIGYLGSSVFQKSEVPLWLRSVVATASIFQATATGLAFIIGGLFAYYRFFKEETYWPLEAPARGDR